VLAAFIITVAGGHAGTGAPPPPPVSERLVGRKGMGLRLLGTERRNGFLFTQYGRTTVRS
jgi:hypothetical protein